MVLLFITYLMKNKKQEKKYFSGIWSEERQITYLLSILSEAPEILHKNVVATRT